MPAESTASPRPLAHSEATEAYGAYLNALPRAREHYAADELAHFEADLGKAKAQMERAWLESHPTQGEPT